MSQLDAGLIVAREPAGAPVWPRRRATAGALAVTLAAQAVLFTVVTRGAFFVGDDFFHFQLAQERSLLHFMATPILGVYPAPGHRFVTFVFQELAPLNYGAARGFHVALILATTVLLGHLVRTLARSEAWWTVALLAPFAFSLTLVSAVWWWSSGLPVNPGLLFTAIAMAAWIRAYTQPNPRLWVAVAVVAVAAAGGFYLKSLLIPLYLLLLRLLVLPRLVNLPTRVGDLWRERWRWVAMAVLPALFLAVFVLSGLAGRSTTPGERPYLEFFAASWFHALVPVSFLNAPVDGPGLSTAAWGFVLAGQVVFWAVVAVTWRRSALALRGWLLFVVVFLANMAMIGTARLPTFGVQIAYWLRYYPEVVFFLPLVLALALRQGAERRQERPWERTRLAAVLLGTVPVVFAASLAAWGPGLVSDSEGAPARAWWDNLREDLDAVAATDGIPRIVDSETPEYIMATWMAPRNRVSAILRLLDRDLVFNELADPMYVVLDDGQLAEADFRPAAELVSPTGLADEARILRGGPTQAEDSCIAGGGQLEYRPGAPLAGERLAVRARYAGRGGQPATVEVDTGDLDRRFRHVKLRPAVHDAELVALDATRVKSLRIEPSSGDTVCIERLEIGSIGAHATEAPVGVTNRHQY